MSADETKRAVTARIPVAVVMVSYRSGPFALRALSSLRAELDSELIELKVFLVENASGDEALLRREIDARFSDFAHLVVSPENGGYGAGNNLGLQAAVRSRVPFRYVHFLNPDTEIRGRAVTRLVTFLEAHPKAGLAGGSFEHEDGTPWSVAFRFPTPVSELEGSAAIGVLTRALLKYRVPLHLGDEPTEVDWVSGASMMFRREVLEQVGGFDEGFFLYFEEVDLCLRTKTAGWEIWYVPDSRVMHVRGQSTGVTALGKRSRLPPYWFESRRRYFYKHYGAPYAAAADAAFLVGHGLGALKRFIKRQPASTPPRVLWDGLKSSVIWPKNRRGLGPERCYVLPSHERS